MRLSPEVLPVVSIHSIRLMMIFPEGTPFRLEEENVEIGIFGQSVDKIDLNFRYNMGVLFRNGEKLIGGNYNQSA